MFARLSQKANEPITFAFDSAHACEFREDADFADRDQRFQREGEVFRIGLGFLPRCLAPPRGFRQGESPVEVDSEVRFANVFSW